MAIADYADPSLIKTHQQHKVIIFDALRGDERKLVDAISEFIALHKPLFINTWVGGITIYTMIVFEE